MQRPVDTITYSKAVGYESITKQHLLIANAFCLVNYSSIVLSSIYHFVYFKVFYRSSKFL